MKRQKLRTILLIAISASLGGVAYKTADHIWQNKSKLIQKTAVNTLNLLPEAALQIKDFHRAQIEGDRKVWEIFGEEAHYLKTEGELLIQKPRIFFYQKDNSTIQATGTEGHLWLQGEDKGMEKAQLKGNVQVNFQGYVLNANEALYLKEKNQVVLPGRVMVRGAGMELEGVDMELSLDELKMRVNRSVRTTVEPGKMGKTKGQSDEETEN